MSTDPRINEISAQLFPNKSFFIDLKLADLLEIGMFLCEQMFYAYLSFLLL